MRTITLYRRDYRMSADNLNESLFECVLYSLGIAKEKWDEIDEIEIDVEAFRAE